ncbi:uncharacterized protein LOC115891071 isoform X2 [Sitophilus oryzae]|uniref:Uncharacterized protein LOC115891071 isoform X2 n=1 Tax=Sitophilus oryzae TaxID=7048 RepID=A0A6J2YVX0_SITOR|nr:uncharacterized protein LOC115891071 isoform X2 [Sitophilus oryzae]
MTKRACLAMLVAAFTLFLPICCDSAHKVTYTTEGHFDKGKPLQCYECNSEHDSRCVDPFEPYASGIVNCTDIKPPEHLLGVHTGPNQRLKATVCRKIVQEVNMRKRVIRECGYIRDIRDNKNCHKVSGTKDVELLYCACTKSLCNGAENSQSSSLVAVILSTFLTYIIFF